DVPDRNSVFDGIPASSARRLRNSVRVALRQAQRLVHAVLRNSVDHSRMADVEVHLPTALAWRADDPCWGGFCGKKYHKGACTSLFIELTDRADGAQRRGSCNVDANDGREPGEMARDR